MFLDVGIRPSKRRSRARNANKTSAVLVLPLIVICRSFGSLTVILRVCHFNSWLSHHTNVKAALTPRVPHQVARPTSGTISDGSASSASDRHDAKPKRSRGTYSECNRPLDHLGATCFQKQRDEEEYYENLDAKLPSRTSTILHQGSPRVPSREASFESMQPPYIAPQI